MTDSIQPTRADKINSILPSTYDRAAVINGLRDLAEYLERNPGVPTPQSVKAQYSVFDGDGVARVAEVERVAELLNRHTRVTAAGDMIATRRFGSAVVEYAVFAKLLRTGELITSAPTYVGEVHGPIERLEDLR